MNKFNNIIVRRPCETVCEGITSNPQLGKPDYQKAIKQHNEYISALLECGVKRVTVLEADERFPDSCFVEDSALLTEKCAIITNPGAETRKGETEIIADVVKTFYQDDVVEHIMAPGTLEGGDVMMVGNTFYVGLSERTNEEGIKQLKQILSKYGMNCIQVPLKEVLHLKTGVNYIENNNLLVSGEFVDMPLFENYNKIVIPIDEAYAANCIWVNDTVIVPEGYPKTLAAIKELGYKTIEVDTSEFRKIDGGLSCLSLRF